MRRRDRGGVGPRWTTQAGRVGRASPPPRGRSSAGTVRGGVFDRLGESALPHPASTVHGGGARAIAAAERWTHIRHATHLPRRQWSRLGTAGRRKQGYDFAREWLRMSETPSTAI